MAGDACPAPSSLESEMVKRLPYMRPSERSVAELLLNDSAARNLNLDQLARKAAVSASSVTRMCKMLGFSGFRPFRLRWLEESIAKQPAPVVEASRFSTLYGLLESTERLLSPNLQTAAALIRSAQKVFVYGATGTGSAVADQVAHGLRVAGKFAVSLPSDQNTIPFTDSSIVLLILSHRGGNEQIACIAEQAKQNGSAIVVITGNAGSRLAGLADVLLLTDRPLRPNGELDWVVIRMLQFAATHALVMEVEAQQGLPAVSANIHN